MSRYPAAPSTCIRWLLLVVIAYTTIFRVVTIDKPFDYDDESTGGSFNGIMARDYLRISWARTRGMPVVTVGERFDTPVVFYPDHPPVVPLLVALVYRAFAIGEWQTRAPTAFATVLSVIVLFALMRRTATDRSAVLAAALFATMPMTLYFGGQPEVLGMPLVLGALLTIAAYLRFQTDPGLRSFAILLAAFALAAVSDWPAFLLVPVLALHGSVTRARDRWPWTLAFALCAAALFAFLYVYVKWAARLPWTWMLPLLKGRTALGGNAPFTTTEWLRIAWTYNSYYHTVPLLAATAVWLLWKGLRFGMVVPGGTPTRLLLGWGVLHVALGREGVYRHEWWWWPLTPGIAAASALAIDEGLRVWQRHKNGRSLQWGLAAAVVAFGSWTTLHAYGKLYPSRADAPFSAMELGRAIRAAAPQPSDLAMLVWSGDDPEVFFYGDRALRVNIWSIRDFTSRRSDAFADLVFSDLQPWPGSAAGIVFPRLCQPQAPALYAYLAERYSREPLPPDLASKFEVFVLKD
jgi:hypothetical protein